MSEPNWNDVVAKFSKSINMSVEDVEKILLEKAVETKDDVGLEVITSVEFAPNSAWFSWLPSVKQPTLLKALSELRRAAVSFTSVEPAKVVEAPRPVLAATSARLAAPPDDQTFLDSLVTGGKLNGTITPADAISAVRVAFAVRFNLFEAPKALTRLIEDYANAMETPADDVVYQVLDTIREREHADILHALGLNARAISQARTNDFIQKLQKYFWPGLNQFHLALKAWFEGWRNQTNDPTTFMTMFTSMMSGGVGMMPGMLQPPDVASLRDAEGLLTTQINRLFGGLYAIPVARTLAADAVRITNQLSDGRLCHAAGIASREELLKRIGVSITEAESRMEKTVSTYVLNALNIRNISDAELPAFASSLLTLGNSMDLDSMSHTTVASNFKPTSMTRSTKF